MHHTALMTFILISRFRLNEHYRPPRRNIISRVTLLYVYKNNVQSLLQLQQQQQQYKNWQNKHRHVGQALSH